MAAYTRFDGDQVPLSGPESVRLEEQGGAHPRQPASLLGMGPELGAVHPPLPRTFDLPCRSLFRRPPSAPRRRRTSRPALDLTGASNPLRRTHSLAFRDSSAAAGSPAHPRRTHPSVGHPSAGGGRESRGRACAPRRRGRRVNCAVPDPLHSGPSHTQRAISPREHPRGVTPRNDPPCLDAHTVGRATYNSHARHARVPNPTPTPATHI